MMAGFYRAAPDLGKAGAAPKADMRHQVESLVRFR